VTVGALCPWEVVSVVAVGLAMMMMKTRSGKADKACPKGDKLGRGNEGRKSKSEGCFTLMRIWLHAKWVNINYTNCTYSPALSS